MPAESGTTGCLQWAVAFQPAPGEPICGDAWRIEAGPRTTLVAVADGLGHGPEAEASARASLEAVSGSEGRPAERIAQAHRLLQRTRGSVLGVAQIAHDTGELRWAGIGNVEAVVHRRQGGRIARTRLFMQSGLLGHRLTTPRESVVALQPGDVLVVLTDGVEEAFADVLKPGLDLEDAAVEGLAAHARGTDDATILIARYLPGEEP